jgi:hypothetical protein
MSLETISDQPSLENLLRQLKESFRNAPVNIAIFCEAHTKYEQIKTLLIQIETAGENIDQIKNLVRTFLDTRETEKDTIERAQQSAFDIETQIFLYYIYKKLGKEFQANAEETLEAIGDMVININ